ncbi:MAG: hypothetical protein WA087_01760 [Candidatus Saccharimonadales bacterium]
MDNNTENSDTPSLSDGVSTVAPQNDVVNAKNVSPEPQISSPQVKPKMARSKQVLFLMLLCLTAVLVVGVAVFSMLKPGVDNNANISTALAKNEVQFPKDKSILPAVSTEFADKYVPGFSDMRGYAENGDEHWYATFGNIIRTNKNGYMVITPADVSPITNFTDVITVNGQIWIGGQGGVGKYNSSDGSVKTYLHGKYNTVFKHDKYSDKLYVATSEGLYEYNSEGDEFNIVEGVDSSLGFDDVAFTKEYIVTVSSTNAYNDSPVRILNKNTKTWAVVSDWQFSAANQRSSDVAMIVVDGVIMVYGRDVGFTGCSDVGSRPETVFYSFNNGTFKKEPELSNIFDNYEARLYDMSSNSIVGDGDCANKDSFTVDLKVMDGKVVATNQRTISDDKLNSSYGYYTYQDRIVQLEKEIGFSSRIYVINKTKDGVVHAVWRGSDYAQLPVSTSLVASNGDVLTGSKVETDITGAGDGYISRIDCGGSTYILDKGAMYQSQYLVSIKKLVNGKLETVYTAKNTPQYESIGVELMLANVDPVCSNGRIVILGLDSIGVFAPNTKLLSKTSHGYIVGEAVLDGNDNFVFMDQNTQSIVIIKDDISKVKVVKFKVVENNSKNSNFLDYNLLGATDKYFSVVSFDYSDTAESDILYTFSALDGSLVKQTTIDGDTYTGAPLNASSFVTQHNNGKTQIIDYTSHDTKTISKAKSIVAKDDSFPIIKNPLTNYIVSDDGYLWFTADSRGLIAYKL